MLRSMRSGISGMLNHQLKLNVTANNIANANTNGFKRSRVTFGDMLSQTIRDATRSHGEFYGSNPMQIGLGVGTASIDAIFEQGSLESTGQLTDLALQGDGFFIVKDGDKTTYTRAGAFQLDAEGWLLGQGGSGNLQGVVADEEENLPPLNNLQNLKLPLSEKAAAHATTLVDLQCNLNVNASDSRVTFDPSEGSDTGISTVYGTAVSGIGGSHLLTITGENATRSRVSGSNGTGNPLAVDLTLQELGVTDLEGLAVAVDDADPLLIGGLTLESTIGELVAALNNQTAGATFTLLEGELSVVREYYGDGTLHNVSITQGETADLLQLLTGGESLRADNGTASTLQASDTFTSWDGTQFDPLELELTATAAGNGLVNMLQGLGDGGVTALADSGLAAGTTTFTTARTEHTTAIDVYDHQGERYTMTINFVKSAVPDRWVFEIAIGEPATATGGSSGSVSFNSEDGSLAQLQFDGGATAFSFDPGNGETVAVSLNAGTPGLFDGITQTTSPTTTVAAAQDGYAMGTLDAVAIDTEGKIMGTYTNGITRTLAQVVLAQFTNPQGVEKDGDTSYLATAASGQPQLHAAGEELDTQILSGHLERSNVDIANEFADMIIAQRGFQANSKIVTTSDEVLQEAIYLKR